MAQVDRRRDAHRRRHAHRSPHRWYWQLAFFSVWLCIALPLVLSLIAHRIWVRRKGMVGLREKLTGHGVPITPGQIMVHGVSLGEVNLMRPLIPHLEAQLGARCFLTTTTETGRARLDEVFADHERAFLPLDLPWAVMTFLRRAKPRLVVLLELEVWPILLCVCHLRGIPVMLLNARVSERSFRGYQRAGAILRPMLRPLVLALGQNPTWSARLVALGVPRDRVVVSGSMKADMVARATPEVTQQLATRFGLRSGQPLLLLSSTSAGAAMEEQVVLQGRLSEWQDRGWQVVICPRHPERGQEIATWIKSIGGVAKRTSAGEKLDQQNQILIVDEIGKLGALYAWTAQVQGIAVVGGSLGSGRGGQNMLEPAAAGCCTVVGWDTRNFPDAMALLRAEGGVIEVGKINCQHTLAKLADDPSQRTTIGVQGQQAWARGRGAVVRSAALVARYFMRA
jgi:3-deoxy-D-manno-octulosonic-acid transferase